MPNTNVSAQLASHSSLAKSRSLLFWDFIATKTDIKALYIISSYRSRQSLALHELRFAAKQWCILGAPRRMDFMPPGNLKYIISWNNLFGTHTEQSVICTHTYRALI